MDLVKNGTEEKQIGITMNVEISSLIKIIKRKELFLFFVIFIAGITLTGWLFDNYTLSSFSRYKPVSPIISITIILLCILFLLYVNFKLSRLTKSIITSLIIILIFYYCAIFLDYIFDFTWDAENFLIKDIEKFGIGSTGYISPICSLLFISICISILIFIHDISNTFKYLGGSLSLLSFLVSSILLIGYLYKAPLLYGSRIIPVALPAAICFWLINITLLRMTELRFWTFNIIKENKITIKLLRYFLPIVIFIDILHGFLVTNVSLNYHSAVLLDAFILLIIVFITVILIIKVSDILGTRILVAEEELKESEKKLYQLNIDKDRFISILGHDLRTPFSALLGLSEVLSENAQAYDIDKIRKIADDINKTAQNTFNLLEDILLWARMQQGSVLFKPQRLSLDDICKNAIEVFKPNAIAKNITINCLTAENIKVCADENMVKAVVRNLVSNAIKFTNIGGIININAEQTSEDVTISVSDNGVGISHEAMKRLFDVGQILTSKGTANEKGTGLGLLLCKEFVEKHKGKIWIESEVDKGSDFKFTLPVSIEQAGA